MNVMHNKTEKFISTQLRHGRTDNDTTQPSIQVSATCKQPD